MNNTKAKKQKITIGILAHVDAGKTTLSEAILYKTGVIRELGRVDHGDAFLDSNVQEKDRGITIFAGQAEFNLPNRCVILLDTPGHVDFSAEMERTLSVLDYACLVISAKDGVQGHTATLWKLLCRYNIPTFIFVNKMDLAGTDREAILSDLNNRLSGGCFDFTSQTAGTSDGSLLEGISMCDEVLLDEFLETGTISKTNLTKAIKERHVFPCYFGSALKLDGVDELLRGLDELTLGYREADTSEGIAPTTDGPLHTSIFRITRDKQGERLTHLKILKGTLHVRDTLEGEKVNQIRIYSGEKFRTVEEAGPGTICALTGPIETRVESPSEIEAVMTYSLILPEGINVHDAYTRLKQLEEEDPQLNIKWNKQLQEIQIMIMGQVHMEVLQELIKERFHFDVEFSDGHIAYKETIAKPIEGAGHYEPLRHYAEVHLLLEPLPCGSGLVFESSVSEDVLDKNWQRLIMTHLTEREHIGTLTGSNITDMKITLIGGRAHDKHTEGGDFRQATYRAIRQGLRKSLENRDVILLEPWYDFELEVPAEMIGRSMADIQRMGGQFDSPAASEETATLTGKAPVSEMKDYVTKVSSYTKGYGHLSCSLAGYRPSHNQAEICEAIGYDADRDQDNPADSIFCSHGAGTNIPWDEADEMMHIPVQRQRKTEDFAQYQRGSTGNEEDLQRIFERTFGSQAAGKKKTNIEAREFASEKERRRKEAERRNREVDSARKQLMHNLPEYLLVDGYNIIFAWEELSQLAKTNIDSAREALIDILNNYQGYRKCHVVAVFDAYKVRGGKRHTEKQGGITVIYTAEAETADTCIERTTYELSGKGGNKAKQYRVRVATSDRLEQIIIMGNDAARVSAEDFRLEVEQVNKEISEFLRKLNRQNEIDNSNKLHIP